MDAGTKLVITLFVLLGIGSAWFFVGARRQTTKMDEDSKHLAMVNSLQAQAENAAERGDYAVAVQRLTEALNYCDKLHTRTLPLERRMAEIKEYRFKIGLRAEAAKVRRQEQAAAELREKQDARSQQQVSGRREEPRAQEVHEPIQRPVPRTENIGLRSTAAAKPEVQPSFEPRPEPMPSPADLDDELKDKLAVATTQPASFNRYYNLVKNEFMKAEDGSITPTPKGIDFAISQIRRQAADEKRAIDDEIRDLTKEIAVADRQRKAEEAAAREESKKARSAARRTIRYDYHVNSRGRVDYFNASTNHVAVGQMNTAKDRASQRRSRAASHKGDIAAMRVDLLDLKKESAALAAVASPHNRNLPPKQYWGDLPVAVQEQLGRVSLSPEEFKKLLDDCGLSEEEFITAAFVLENKERDTDVVVTRLRQLIASRMPPSPDAIENF